MFGKSNSPPQRIDTLVARTVHVQGDIVFSGGMHLEGHVHGNVSSTDGMLSISEHGIVEGSVDVPRVEVHGQVSGDIHASERLTLGAKAQVQGDVAYGLLQMAAGCTINGRLMRLSVDHSPRLIESP
ncbi:MAG: hypothetical protein RL026_1048 [Pseudomonadota bacterium]|jgi:cytoskeletal protein CcmA (bactofilin family)